MLGKRVKVIVDRPLGSCHPKHKDLYYPINYGYIEGVFAPDGEEQDAYILGVDQPISEFEGIVIAVIHRENDVEDKWVVAPEGKMFTKEEIKNTVRFQEQFFDSRVIMKAQQPAAPCEIKQIGLKSIVDVMTKAIVGILAENTPSVYLYGSVVLNDFRLGWSDIDILVLTEKQISSKQAERLVHLRHELTAREPENPYYCLFEGGMLRLCAFLSGAEDTVVYWGTSGERVTNCYDFDSFSKKELLENGVLLYGKDVRNYIYPPTFDDLLADVRRHYETIRAYGSKTGKSIYSFGWLLDVSRCIYTLRTGNIIAKTKAGEWALENGLCPDSSALETALRLRNTPELFDNDESLQHCAENLGNVIQAYADVLEKELYGSF